MKHKIGVIEGCSKGLTSVKQGVKVLEAIARNTNLSFDLRYIKIGSKSKVDKDESAFKDAAENCRSLDAILVMDDIENDEIKELNLSVKAASTALQYELETTLFDSLDKYPVIFEAEQDEERTAKDIVKPVGAIVSVANFLDYVGYKRFGDKVRLAAYEASVILSSKENDQKTKEDKDEELTNMVIDYINKHVDEPMISAWGEI
jgi:isocitrate/isopropylmalate dehydrogenase